MPDIDRWTFMKDCLAVIKSRIGVTIPHPEENLAIKGEVVDPERYRRGIQVLRDYAPEDKLPLFDRSDPEITPEHVVELITACIAGDYEVAHLVECEDCRSSIGRLMFKFVYVLNGSTQELVGLLDTDRIRKRR